MEISYLIIGLAIGLIVALIVWIVLHKKISASTTELNNCRQNLAVAQSIAEKEKEHYEFLLEQQEKERAKEREQYAQGKEEREKELGKQLNFVREQLQNATNELLKQREAELKNANKEQIGIILNPLQEEIRQMKEAVERNKESQTKTTSTLEQKITDLMQQSMEIGTKADNLAKALTSENKTQGNFGEVRLVELLENMGLEKGVQFDVQETLRDDNGHAVVGETGGRLVPDVILHFTDGRDAIIDSKMSIKAFEDYMNADNEEARQVALKEHIRSVRAHVDELSKKKYNNYIAKGRQSLNYVLMYMFSESALQLALCNDTGLWKYAFDKNVFITGSQNLYAIIRLTKESWVMVEQTKNQEEMIKCAETVIKRVDLFEKRFQELGTMIGKLGDKYREVETTTADSGKSISVAARRLLEFGKKDEKSRAITRTDIISDEEVGSNEEI